MAGVWKQYNGDSAYLFAFVGSLVLLYCQRRAGSDTGKKAVIALSLAVLFVFNDFSYRIAGKFTDIKTYYRFLWMLPVLFLVAYQLTVALTSGKKGRICAAVAATVVLCLVGTNCFITRANLSRPENIYGLDPDTITMADAVIADWGEEKEDLPVVAFDMYLEYQVRTYEPRICWGISRKAYLYQAAHGYDGKRYPHSQRVIAAVNEGIQGDSKALRRSLDKIGMDYLVVRTEFLMDSYLAGISVLPIAQSEKYTLYKVS